MKVLVAWLVLGMPAAAAAPLALYDTARDSKDLAPIAPTPPCGGWAVACSAAPEAKTSALPFDYGVAVSGMVGGSTHGRGISGEAVSGWIKPKDVPVTVYFDIERFQPFGK
jgi:hypothetical protein